MFRKVLIANRGEIAVRILRACHELGVLVVAVYSEQDRGALHVRYADEAYSLGSGSSEDTYLDGDKILAISGKAGVDAIHPGYGFLAENPDFAQACHEKGVVFIGPSGQSLEIMGRKLTARSNMTRAWIPVIPGGEFPPDDKKGALKVANDLRFPVLIKAVAGGGGKGIRRVDRSEHFFEAVRVAGVEAKAAFGNDALYLEKYVPRARHIEFQILADHYGNIIHLFDRECSIQRRYQKVLEECPSPFLDDTTRLRMAGVALSAALAVKYTGAGTVEFLVDPEKNFYFLELNARLQVEHPVTEMVTGVDIVKAQIRIAEGEKLSLTQRDVQPIGASLVCRIYAEGSRCPAGPGFAWISESTKGTWFRSTTIRSLQRSLPGAEIDRRPFCEWTELSASSSSKGSRRPFRSIAGLSIIHRSSRGISIPPSWIKNTYARGGSRKTPSGRPPASPLPSGLIRKIRRASATNTKSNWEMQFMISR